MVYWGIVGDVSLTGGAQGTSVQHGRSGQLTSSGQQVGSLSNLAVVVACPNQFTSVVVACPNQFWSNTSSGRTLQVER